MGRFIAIIGLVAVLYSCNRKIVPQPSINTRDSIRVEYIEVIKEVPVEIPIPVERVVNVVPTDTMSVVETSLAKSSAGIRSGFLWHNIENKQENKPTVNIPVKEVVQIEYRDKEVEVKVPYPVPAEFTKWQSFKIKVGGYAIAAFFALLGFFLLKTFVFKKF